jgi:predicted secreted protein
MSVFTGILVYVIVWWTVFFAVLPWGVRRGADNGQGYDAGAPANPRLWLKAGITTLIAAVLFAGIYYVIDSGLIHMRRGPQ